MTCPPRRLPTHQICNYKAVKIVKISDSHLQLKAAPNTYVYFYRVIGILPVRPSVRLSVTFRYYIETTYICHSFFTTQ